MRRRVFIVMCVAGCALGVVVAAAIVVPRLLGGPDGRLAEAVALAPASTERFSWTDWAAVREEVGSDVSPDSTVEEMEELIGAGFDRDLVEMSAMNASASVLHERLGFSPAGVDWELLAQGGTGSLLLLGLGSSYDLDELGERLEDAGYERDDREDGLTSWRGTDDLVAGIGGLSPQFTAFALDRDERILVASDSEAYVDQWPANRREEDGDTEDDGITQVLGAVDDPLTASLNAGDRGCAAYSLGQADTADQTRAADLVEEAGGLGTYRGSAITLAPDGDVQVALAFDSEDRARADADSRSILASGEAPGQGGTFPERFDVRTVTAEDGVVLLDLDPVDDTAFPFSDLISGPVLFASC